MGATGLSNCFELVVSISGKFHFDVGLKVNEGEVGIVFCLRIVLRGVFNLGSGDWESFFLEVEVVSDDIFQNLDVGIKRNVGGHGLHLSFSLPKLDHGESSLDLVAGLLKLLPSFDFKWESCEMNLIVHIVYIWECYAVFIGQVRLL